MLKHVAKNAQQYSLQYKTTTFQTFKTTVGRLLWKVWWLSRTRTIYVLVYSIPKDRISIKLELAWSPNFLFGGFSSSRRAWLVQWIGPNLRRRPPFCRAFRYSFPVYFEHQGHLHRRNILHLYAYDIWVGDRVVRQKWRPIRVSFLFWKLFANKLSGLLQVLFLPLSSSRSRKFIAVRMCRT